MPSTYTGSGIEKPGSGEQTGTWDDTVNTNFDIIDRLTSQVGTISLTGTTHTLTISDGSLSEGQYAVLSFGGSPSGTNTVTISPNDAKRVFHVRNASGQSVILTQGSGGNVTVANGATAIVYCDGAGSGAAVVNLTSGYTVASAAALTATLGIAGGGTGATTASGARTALGLGSAAVAALIDDDTMATATASNISSAESTKAYVDTEIAGITGIPSGVIVMWSGAVSAIPSGWVICDGTNGTPNLTGRFVIHADADSGGTYDVGDTGGAATVTLTESQIPGHTHTFSGTTGAETIGEVTGTGNVSSAPADATRATGAANNQSHTHSFSGTTASTGGGTSHENLPPYYALAYIMKT